MPDFGAYPLGTESLSLDESESTFENKSGLAEDLKFLASMPELCDVTFLVGETREPVCAVKVSRSLSAEPEMTFASLLRRFYQLAREYSTNCSTNKRHPSGRTNPIHRQCGKINCACFLNGPPSRC